MSLSIRLGNFLFRNFYFLYRPLYASFKKRQDAQEILLLRQHIRPGMQIIDIGANIGFYARILSELAGPEGKVHCFEPDQKNFAHLSAQVKGLSNVLIHNKAVGPKTEMLKIYTSPNLNVDHRTYEPDVYEQVIEVPALSLDDYLAPQDFKADFIKMDIQGFEMDALRGMQQVLAKNPCLKMISEFWPYGLKKAGSSASAYLAALKSAGFNVQLMKQDRLESLSDAAAKNMENLEEVHYFNILASK